jgi:hypothetical protein
MPSGFSSLNCDEGAHREGHFMQLYGPHETKNPSVRKAFVRKASAQWPEVTAVRRDQAAPFLCRVA